MEKRYSIVRVDGQCPEYREEDIYLIDRIKMFPCFNDKRLSCKNCLYGDTKEQLIRKVKTAIRRRAKYLKRLLVLTEHSWEEISFYDLAKEIVEFLGVK